MSCAPPRTCWLATSWCHEYVLVFHHAGAYGWEISHHDFLSHPHPGHVYFRNGA